LNFIDNLQPKTPYPKFQEICPVIAVYFDANRQPPSLTWRSWKLLFARLCERT